MNIQAILNHKKTIFYIIIIQFLLRTVVASFSTLGNDEVYYTLYAKYLDYAYFDHPPFVGWLIWFTTFGNQLEHEFFFRLGALCIGSFNIYLLYKIGFRLKNRITGNLTALLASTSFYIAIISGTFIMPDTPQSLFWVLSLYVFLLFIEQKKNKYLIWFGLLTGLALLCKYHAIYLWIGAFIYLLLKDRKQFFNPYLYLAGLLSILLFCPVILWNFQSEYSGLGYHENRVVSNSLIPNFKHFFSEFFGQIFYNNPFNIFLIISSFILIKKRKLKLNSSLVFLLSASLPLVLTTLVMAMYNKTLPHWSGPSYFGLLILAGFILVETKAYQSKLNRTFIKGSGLIFLLVIVLGMVQIKTGKILGNPNVKMEKLGKDDFTVDLSQWKTIGKELENVIPKHSTIITQNWFPASHLTRYFGEKNEVKVYVYGEAYKQHQFLKINKKLGSISLGSDAYYITTSHYYQALDENFIKHFESIDERQVITIQQFGKKKVNLFIWKLNNLRRPLF